MMNLSLLQAGLVLAPIAWIIFGRPPNWFDLALRVTAGAAILSGVSLVGLWLALPLSSVVILGMLLVLAGVAGVLRQRDRTALSERSNARWVGRALALALLAGGGWLTLEGLSGRVQPNSTIDLGFPLDRGLFLVANGGSSALANAHLMTLAPKFSPWRGQSYGVDLIRIDKLGFRTIRRTLGSPRDPKAYRSFGARVVAPCAGRVDAVEEHRRDMPVPMRDRQHIVGNFVRLRCEQAVVFLGHFQQNGISVAAGDKITRGQFLGLVGNSGNTDEPHLHIHAQRAGTPAAPLAGQPLYIRLDSRFPIRNMVMEAHETAR